MPQMAPMWWLILYMVFNFNIMIMHSMLFFNKKYMIKKKMMKNEMFNWKWY